MTGTASRHGYAIHRRVGDTTCDLCGRERQDVRPALTRDGDRYASVVRCRDAASCVAAARALTIG